MLKIKVKSSGTKSNNEVESYTQKDFNIIDKSYISKEKPENKDKQFRTPGKKVVYTSKGGKRAIFDSINLAALIFGVDASSVRARLNGPTLRRRKDDWLKGGKIEYINN